MSDEVQEDGISGIAMFEAAVLLVTAIAIVDHLAGGFISRPVGAIVQRCRGALGGRPRLYEIAEAIHKAGGGTSRNTTAVARLSDGRLVAATQLPVTDSMRDRGRTDGVEDISQENVAGVHMEVSLYIHHVEEAGHVVHAVGASQGFCPDCQDFLTAKGIEMDGSRRGTGAQMWKSPEFCYGREKDDPTANYLWYRRLNPWRVLVPYRTKEAYDDSGRSLGPRQRTQSKTHNISDW